MTYTSCNNTKHYHIGCCQYRHYEHSCCPNCNTGSKSCYTRKIRYYMNPRRHWSCRDEETCQYETGYGYVICHEDNECGERLRKHMEHNDVPDMI